MEFKWRNLLEIVLVDCLSAYDSRVFETILSVTVYGPTMAYTSDCSIVVMMMMNAI